MKLHYYSVVGRGPFPLDMLRYDGAAPDDSVTVDYISKSIGERLPSEPLSYNLVSWQLPTPKRWQSFGFKVENVVTRKI